MAVLWTNDETVRFIQLYRNEPVIWNPKNASRKDRNKVNEAWQRISDSMTIPVLELKRKKEAIMASFRALHKKHLKSINSNNAHTYKPTWIYYDIMAEFLADVYESNLDFLETSGKVQIQDEKLLFTTNEVEEDEVEIDPLRPVRPKRKRPECSNYYIKPQSDTQQDDSDLYCKLLAKKLKNYSAEDREEIMYEIDEIMLQHRRKQSNNIEYVVENNKIEYQTY